jgi:Na+/melibiose symporter-like transporter
MGAASAVKNLMDVLGLMLASLAAGFLLSPDDRYPTVIMLVVIAVLTISAGWTFLSAREKSSPMEGAERAVRIDLRQIFSIDRKAERSFMKLIVSRFIFLLGVYGVQAFAQYYIKDVLQAANPVRATSQLMAALAVMLVIAAALGGWLSDRFGSAGCWYWPACSRRWVARCW